MLYDMLRQGLLQMKSGKLVSSWSSLSVFLLQKSLSSGGYAKRLRCWLPILATRTNNKDGYGSVPAETAHSKKVTIAFTKGFRETRERKHAQTRGSGLCRNEGALFLRYARAPHATYDPVLFPRRVTLDFPYRMQIPVLPTVRLRSWGKCLNISLESMTDTITLQRCILQRSMPMIE